MLLEIHSLILPNLREKSNSFACMDRKNWGDAVATGTFKKGRSEKKVLFEKVHKDRLTTTRTIRPASG
ncbi:hypothetical protein KA005_37540, partial [bacterium]|nr:hypothetical protein [bacterium]